MSVAAPETIVLEPVAPPDSDFGEVLRRALVSIQEQAGLAAV